MPVRFIYDELSSGYPAVIAEYTLSGSTFAIGAVYTHGLGLISSNRGGTKRYFHYDGLGSTHALTDSSGTVTDTYSYSAFGVQESSTGSSVNPYRYVGQWGYYDDGARGSGYGLSLLGWRFYQGDQGRFIQRDKFLGRDYLYTQNVCVTMIDPSGYKEADGTRIIWWNPFTWGYGNYCGGSRSGQGGPPIDKVDACCAAHDRCLSEWYDFLIPYKRTNCDCRLYLCLAIAGMSCESSPNPMQCLWWTSLMMNHMSFRCLSAMPL